jgi:hypothetical protein
MDASATEPHMSRALPHKGVLVSLVSAEPLMKSYFWLKKFILPWLVFFVQGIN